MYLFDVTRLTVDEDGLPAVRSSIHDDAVAGGVGRFGPIDALVDVLAVGLQDVVHGLLRSGGAEDLEGVAASSGAACATQRCQG